MKEHRPPIRFRATYTSRGQDLNLRPLGYEPSRHGSTLGGRVWHGLTLDEPAVEDAKVEMDYRAKSTVPTLRSTFAVRLSAAIHADACTWLPDRSFAHQGR